MSKRPKVEINVDTLSKFREKHLPVKVKYMGTAALNAFSLSNSSPRSVMVNLQMSQIVALIKGEERILHSGVDRRLAELSFELKINTPHNIIDVVDKDGVSYSIIYKCLDTGRVDSLYLPPMASYSTGFGFGYKFTEALERAKLAIGTNTVMEAGAVYAETPTQRDNYGWAFGVNANVAMLSEQETTEDGIIVSDTYVEKLKFKRYFKYRFQFGQNTVPLNIYGDENNYRIMPDIGERVRDDGVLFALREFDPALAPVLFTTKGLMEFDAHFDKATFLKHSNATVIDINVIKSKPSSIAPVFKGTDVQAERLYGISKRFDTRSVGAYDKIKRSEFNFSPKFIRDIVNQKVRLAASEGRKIQFRYKNERTLVWDIELTIEVEVTPGVQYKIATLDGGKGIISAIRPQSEMPVDKDGTIADMIIYPTATISRLNLGRLKEAYVTSACTKAESFILKEFKTLGVAPEDLADEQINSLFNILLEFTSLIGNAQYLAYVKASKYEKRETIETLLRNRISIYLPMTNLIPINQVLKNIKNSRFKPIRDKISFMRNGKKITTNEKVGIRSMYTILMNKTGDTWLGTNMSRFNHYGIATSLSKEVKNTTPFRDTAMKALGETEVAATLAYVGTEALAEMYNRTSNQDSLKTIYMNYLTLDKPTAIQKHIDRKKFPIKEGSIHGVFEHFMHTFGAETHYVSTKIDKLRKEKDFMFKSTLMSK